MTRALMLSLIALALGACQAQPPVASQQLSPAQVAAIAERQALLVLQPEEVMEARFISVEQALEETHRLPYCPDSLAALERYLRRPPAAS